MKSMIVAAVATLSLGGAALAATPGAGTWYSGQPAAKTTPAATETCAGARMAYSASHKAHMKSPNLKAAEAKAHTGKAACAAGRSADGIADYDAATKLLGA